MKKRWCEPKFIPRPKAVHLKCVDCCGGQVYEVKLCESYNCPLWCWRTGKLDKEFKDNQDSEKEEEFN